MKTYKFLLVALIATGVFTACNNEEVAVQTVKQGPEISFRLQGGMPEEITTRSLATTRDNLEAFVVFGTDNVLAGLTPPKLIFDGQTVARQLDGSFAYAPKAYYSENAANAGFFAFSPVSAIDPADITIPTSFLAGASFDYTVPEPDNTGEITQVDLLVAGEAITTSAAFSTDVSLVFEHALARIFVTAQNYTDDPIIIKQLTLKNLVKKGTLNVTPGSAWSWTPSTVAADKGDYEYILAESGVAVPGWDKVSYPADANKFFVTSMEQGMMVLPQATVNLNDDYVFDPGDFALEIVYDFANLKDQTKYIMLQDTYPFDEGMQYRINIAFNEFLAITFEVVVELFDTPIQEGITP